MGLDIYLKKYEDKANTDLREAKYEKRSEKLWSKHNKYEDFTESEKDEINKELEVLGNSLNLDKYGCDKSNVQEIEFDSKIDPDHYFKLGYFRSSYNSSGINRILRNLGLMDLGEMMLYHENYCFRPDWEIARKNVLNTIDELSQKTPLIASSVSKNFFSKERIADSEKKAIDIVLSEMERENSMRSYSSAKGDFYLDGIEITALIPGVYSFLGKEMECVYVVSKMEMKWYIDALKIVLETIDYVLSQKDSEKYYLYWSG